MPSNPLSLSGLGDITSGSFVVPQNPLKQNQVVVMPAAPGGGMGMAGFRGAFMGRR
jgi:hypothetical protein